MIWWLYDGINILYIHIYLVGGVPTPLKNDGVQVSWGYYSQYMQKYKMFTTTNQWLVNIWNMETWGFPFWHEATPKSSIMDDLDDWYWNSWWLGGPPFLETSSYVETTTVDQFDAWKKQAERRHPNYMSFLESRGLHCPNSLLQL